MSSYIQKHLLHLLLLVLVVFLLPPLFGCRACGDDEDCWDFTTRRSPSSSPPPPEEEVSSGQGLIAINTRTNVGYVPIYTRDANGDSQIAVVDLEVGVSNPIMEVIALPGTGGHHTTQPVASTFFPVKERVLVEARQDDSSVNVYVIDTAADMVINTIPATGITHSGTFGGIIANPLKRKGIVAGTSSIGLLDLSGEPFTFDAGSVINTSGTDSLSLNFKTQILFIASDGTNSIVDTSVSPPVPTSFQSTFGTTDGNAQDTSTNILIVDPEFQDLSYVFNMSELDTGSVPASAPNATVPGLGTMPPVGEGPGGQAAINLKTHQALIADEFGHNFRLIQLPKKNIVGAPNNNGQPGSGTTADANSAYTLAASVLPKGDVNGVPTQLGILGDPNSLSVDPVHNLLYALADTTPSFHSGWGTATPLFLVRVDLNHPVIGGNPNGPMTWDPDSEAIRLP